MIGDYLIHPKYGPMYIIEEIPNTNPKMVKVKFTNTNNIIKTQIGHFNKMDCVDDLYKFYLKQIFITPSGPATIIQFLGQNSNFEPMVRIQYGNTGTIADVVLEDLIDGNIEDATFNDLMEKIILMHNSDGKHGNIDIDRLYTSNMSGLFKIISIYNSKRCYIRFISTGSLVDVGLQNAMEGSVVDKYQRNIMSFNKSYLGIDYDRWLRSKLRDRWCNMINRCTKETAACYNAYGGIGVKIDSRWLEFDNFFNDVFHLPQFEKYYNQPFMYCLDKDYLQLSIPKSLRVYSPKTCMFIHNNDNVNIEAYEKRKANPDLYSSKYYGVSTKNGGRTFRATIKMNGIDLFLKTYSNEIAAASCYNWHHRKNHCYELFPLLNDIDEMPPEEFFKYNVNPMTLYKVIRDID